jgi:glucose/arabinose dehydrogenase
MFRKSVFAMLVVLCALSARGGILPGFGFEEVAPTEGFVTALAVSPDGGLHYAVRTGEIYRIEGNSSRKIAHVETSSTGNEALLGLAFRNEREIIVHYVRPDHTADVIGSVDVATGVVTPIATFLCDGGNACPSEHHGGNLIIAPDGAIFFGIGDFGGGVPAQNPASPGGKIHRVSPTGEVSVWASGLRNPFDLAWDRAANKLVVSDNGPVGEDEINFVSQGDNLGWPYTVGNQEPMNGMKPPAFVFEGTVAPTGLVIVDERRDFPRGLLVAGFVTRALYYFPDFSEKTMPPPIEILTDKVGPVLDIVEGNDGAIYFASARSIFRLQLPMRGDADGNRKIDADDPDALAREILDGDGVERMRAHGGAFPGGWGSDVNGDGLIDARDIVALARLRAGRPRPVR